MGSPVFIPEVAANPFACNSCNFEKGEDMGRQMQQRLYLGMSGLDRKCSGCEPAGIVLVE